MDSYQERLQGSLTGPTNHHKAFRLVSTSLTHCLRNFPGCYPSQYCSLASMLNCGVLKSGLPKKKRCTFGDISSHFDPFKSHSGCYNITKGFKWHPESGLKRIEVTTHQRCTFLSGSPLLRTPQLSMLAREKSWDGWLLGKFLRWRVNENEARWKCLWWFVGSVSDSLSCSWWLSRLGRGPRLYRL